jgi:hypothetical protein
MTSKDIPALLECPFCYKYATNSLVAFTKHMEDDEGILYDFCYYALDCGVDLGVYVERRLNCLRVAESLDLKEVFASKESSEEAPLQLIKDRLLEGIAEYPTIDADAQMIYQHFLNP